MKFRTKIYFMIVAIACVSVIFALLIVYEKTKEQFLYEIHSKLKSVAATGSIFLLGDALEKIQTTADQNTEAYLTVQNQLRSIREAAQRADVSVQYVYTIRPSKAYQGYVETVVDASIDPSNFSPVGQLHLSANTGDVTDHLEQIYSPSELTVTAWGSFLSGFAPIYNAQGEYVATLGIDINMIQVFDELHHLFYLGIYALLASIAIALSLGYFLAHNLTKTIGKFVVATHTIEEGNYDTHIDIETKDEFYMLASKIHEMAEGLKERGKLKINFSRYVSKHILEKLVHTEINMQGEYRKLTVLFADIRNFASLAEKLVPEEAVQLLNEYFERMLEIVFRNEGTLDKFIGDEIMVDFGSPLEDPCQEENAFRSAIQMRKAVEQLSQEWQQKGRPRIEVCIGIHTGAAVVGNIGASQKLDYTAIGDTVNVASRLTRESAKREGIIILSEVTHAAISQKFPCKSLGKVELSGRLKQMEIFTPEDVEKYSESEPQS